MSEKRFKKGKNNFLCSNAERVKEFVYIFCTSLKSAVRYPTKVMTAIGRLTRNDFVADCVSHSRDLTNAFLLNTNDRLEPNEYQHLEDRIMSEATSYFSIAVAVIILLVDLWAIISVFRSDKTVGVKAAWAISLIIFPVIGLIVWGVAGPRGIKVGPSSPEHSKG
jgi:hypothetical protein